MIDTKFWAKVDIQSLDKCWNFTGHKVRNKEKYGRVNRCGIRYLAHRYAAHQLGLVDKPEALSRVTNLVLHECDNPSCCNPTHLFIGTQKENMQQAATRKRLVIKRGESHNMAKLSEDEVAQIRLLYSTGTITQQEIGDIFGVTQANISLIVLKKKWTHI